MNILYDHNLDSYQGFFDHEWSKHVLDFTKGTNLEYIVKNICISWKGISNARRLPYLMTDMISAATEGAVNRLPVVTSEMISKLIHRISNGLEINKITLKKSDRKALVDELEQTNKELIERSKEKPYTANRNEVWPISIDQDEFIFSLWMSEVNAYCAIYFAYEIFLIDSIKSIKKLAKLRTTSTRFQQELESLVGPELTESLWSGNVVEKARLIRHALVHNGRKITADLQRYRDKLVLTDDDEVVIMPENTTQLYKDLQVRVSHYCNKLIDK